MSKKEIMLTGYRKKRDAKITTILTIFLVVLFILSEELFVDNEMAQMATKLYYLNSIVKINITVLPQSNSSVEIFCEESVIEHFSPILTNFTLAPGESFTESYTYIDDFADAVVYFCWCTLENSNATIQWWYEAIYSAKPDNGFIGIDLLFISGAFLLSTMTLVFIIKRKSNR